MAEKEYDLGVDPIRTYPKRDEHQFVNPSFSKDAEIRSHNSMGRNVSSNPVQVVTGAHYTRSNDACLSSNSMTLVIVLLAVFVLISLIMSTVCLTLLLQFRDDLSYPARTRESLDELFVKTAAAQANVVNLQY